MHIKKFVIRMHLKMGGGGGAVHALPWRGHPLLSPCLRLSVVLLGCASDRPACPLLEPGNASTATIGSTLRCVYQSYWISVRARAHSHDERSALGRPSHLTSFVAVVYCASPALRVGGYY